MGRGAIVVENRRLAMLRARNTVDIGSVCFGRAARYCDVMALRATTLKSDSSRFEEIC